ncbi:cysteine desulfurase NifS [Geothermobacter hydrogeniphilus]|uniref:Cysteine desulfurase n=1 Tax=Geothermobacter hydrogeniphilus TaxID=1969733 RepID=A0A1X0Y8N0_9BACT|nr:cysteine desulfurase NifS [Geothermobacter hydrogeniphilus]ORJ61551.1 cysteine desulfurase NifS [Geothermobacter hydrogeniphilus]
MKQIYLDHNATTPIHPEVLEAMLPFLRDHFGNPSSIHWAGRAVAGAIEQAREQVASLLGCRAAEIVFTSCGSEGDNLAIKGTVDALRGQGNHIITTEVEHPAVLETCRYLQERGCRVTFLPVDRRGALDLEQLESAITDQTILISVMWGNNETGNLFPLAEIGAIAARHKVCLHSDAVQAAGKLAIDVRAAGIDLLVLSGHKIGAPKGVGAVYIKNGTRLSPLLHGGHQERNRRAGTHNVASIVALGKACELAAAGLATYRQQVRRLRDRLEDGILATIPQVHLNGHPDRDLRLANTLNISFAGIEGESLLLNLDLHGIAASSGSACSSGSLDASHVLRAMGLESSLARSSVRFSLGAETTEEDIDHVLEVLPASVQRLREMSPVYKA